MQTPAKFLGMVRIWQDGDEWSWVPVGQWALEDAELGDRYRGPDGEDVIFVKRGADGEYVRAAAFDLGGLN